MQENRKNVKNPKLDDFANFKNLLSLNDSLLEATKAAIKGKNNDIALKMLENLGDRPELWYEYLSIAILNQNFIFTKSLVDKYQIDIKQTSNLNAGLLYSDVYEGKLKKPIENKENFLSVECPLIIQAAIGGDLDIFKFLVDRGANLQTTGHIAISRKNKNSVISNVLGAAAFYGRVSLVHFILEKYPKVDLNFKASEKKAKAKQFSLNKEFTDFTPAHLAISSEISDDDTIIEILNLLSGYRADLSLLDNNKNNIFHLASKFENLRVVQFLLEELKLGPLASQINKEGQSPISITADKSIIDYLQSIINSSADPKIEDDLNELIESVNKDKQKRKTKKKKGAEKDDVLLNSTEFQETFKLPLPKPAPVEVKKTEREREVSSSTSQTKREIKEDYLEYDDEVEYATTDRKKKDYNKSDNYEKKSYYNDAKEYKDRNYNSYNSNYGYNSYNKKDYYNNYNNYYSEDGYYNKSGNKNYEKNYTKGREEFVDTNLPTENKETTVEATQPEKSKEVNSTVNNGNTMEVKSLKPKTGLIGLSSKPKKNKEKKEAKKEHVIEPEVQNIVEENVKSLETPKEEERIETVNDETKDVLNQEQVESKQQEEEDYEIDENFIGEDEVVDVAICNVVEEFKDSSLVEVKSEEHPKEVSLKSRKESEVIVPQDKVSQAVQEVTSVSQDKSVKEITTKYLYLEQQYEKEKQEKMLMEKYIHSQKILPSPSINQTKDIEHSLADLLFLANEELERKSKLVSELQSKIDFLEGKHLDNLCEEQLEGLSNFYGSKLSSIVSALTNINNKQK